MDKVDLLWPIILVSMIVLWLCIIIAIFFVIRFGKKQDVNTMKELMDIDDDDLAANILQIEDDNEQAEALRVWHDRQHKNRGEHGG